MAAESLLLLPDADPSSASLENVTVDGARVGWRLKSNAADWGLVAQYTLDEASGTREDSWGSYDLTDNNTVGQAAGKVGNAASFDAASSESLTNGTLAGQVDAFEGVTVAAWLKWSSGVAQWVRLGGDIYQGVGSLQINDQGASSGYLFAVADIGDFSPVILSCGAPLGDGAWHLIIFWYDPASRKLNAQIDNGAVTTSSTALAAHPSFSVNRAFRLSGNSTGCIDAVFVFNSVIPTAARTAIWNSGNGLSAITGCDSGGPSSEWTHDFGQSCTLASVATREDCEGSATIRYQYGFGASDPPALNGTWLTEAQLATALNGNSGRYLRIAVQFNSNGSDRATFRGIAAEITAQGLNLIGSNNIFL